VQQKLKFLHTGVLITFNHDLKYVPARGAVRLIFCGVHTSPYVACIDFTKTACGIVETFLKDASCRSTLDIAGT